MNSRVKLSKDSTITVRAEEIAQNNNNIKMNIGGISEFCW